MCQWRRRFVSVVALVLFTGASPSLAQEALQFGRGWEINAFLGLIDDRPEFEPSDAAFRIAHEGILGGRLGYTFDSNFFLQGEVAYSPMDLGFEQDGERITENLEALFFTAAVGYNVQPVERLQLFLRGGAGGVRWSAASSDEVDFTFDAGVGMRFYIASGLAVRTDVRMHLVPSALATTREELNPEMSVGGEDLWLPELSAGLSLFLGGDQAIRTETDRVRSTRTEN